MRAARLIVAALAPIVPRARRADWRRQWDAELAHYAVWLRRDGHGRGAVARRVLGRSPIARSVQSTTYWVRRDPRPAEELRQSMERQF